MASDLGWFAEIITISGSASATQTDILRSFCKLGNFVHISLRNKLAEMFRFTLGHSFFPSVLWRAADGDYARLRAWSTLLCSLTEPNSILGVISTAWNSSCSASRCRRKCNRRHPCAQLTVQHKQPLAGIAG